MLSLYHLGQNDSIQLVRSYNLRFLSYITWDKTISNPADERMDAELKNKQKKTPYNSVMREIAN